MELCEASLSKYDEPHRSICIREGDGFNQHYNTSDMCRLIYCSLIFILLGGPCFGFGITVAHDLRYEYHHWTLITADVCGCVACVWWIIAFCWPGLTQLCVALALHITSTVCVIMMARVCKRLSHRDWLWCIIGSILHCATLIIYPIIIDLQNHKALTQSLNNIFNH
eukprot:Blabericola_migrator_1__12026@NODE_739_length_6686_cov_203_338118_g530_i0_p5_GENE_NODE_739_length_6686_cov_203_338118_g530_i0NODE_739_length_6686_cov_203_338118_g530_i0_p5_ORF_typecomplete_len167_score12_82MFS_1/PF07690_16/0_13Phage_holin_1/PF04531_13/3_5e03Phage_holin_1/PF04531_13/7_7e02Phage_holin_1/PF04531_13/2_3AC_N/PF16214_5/2_7PMT/PF02366_18/1_3e03PMT/PF02366_18/2_9_NODE_739_length_6686_cov_203_338118_g530_i011071607